MGFVPNSQRAARQPQRARAVRLAVADVVARAVNAEPQPAGIRAGIQVVPGRRGAGRQGRRRATSTPTRCATAAARAAVDELLARDRPADRLRLLRARQRRPDRQEQGVGGGRDARHRGLAVRLQLLHVGRGRAPGGHEHGRLLQARRHADHAHGRRLPAAQRRALPRRHELGLVGEYVDAAEQPALLRDRQVHRRARHPALQRRRAEHDRRRPADARRRGRHRSRATR